VIENVNAFQQCVKTLLLEAQTGMFGTLGIVPTDDFTGYGYIKELAS
jgi:mannose-1-phosphate guanylyltransferase